MNGTTEARVAADANEYLAQFLALNFPEFAAKSGYDARLASLTDKKASILLKVLESEVKGEATFSKRNSDIDDFYGFDLSLNALFSDILASKLPVAPLTEFRPSPLFPRDAEKEVEEQKELQDLGYRVSAHTFSPEQIAKINSEIGNEVFINRGIFTKELSGKEIFEKINNGSIESYLGKNGDTFWIKDQNRLSQIPFFRDLAFDPYILSMVTQYLGCAPVHVQTNLWFSFPTVKDKNNLSTNAQMYHQDKEFVKFIKVFIYLTDVGPDNGPHGYVVGSHVDEAHTHGYGFGERILDEDVERLYGADRVKSLVAPAGTITFGDTSCVHKGVPVEAGHRVMLQLEYASSLYLSPVPPFSELSRDVFGALPYPASIVKRITQNYNNADRAAYQQMADASKAPEVSTFRKVLRLAKRYVKTIA